MNHNKFLFVFTLHMWSKTCYIYFPDRKLEISPKSKIKFATINLLLNQDYHDMMQNGEHFSIDLQVWWSFEKWAYEQTKHLGMITGI